MKNLPVQSSHLLRVGLSLVSILCTNVRFIRLIILLESSVEISCLLNLLIIRHIGCLLFFLLRLHWRNWGIELMGICEWHLMSCNTWVCPCQSLNMMTYGNGFKAVQKMRIFHHLQLLTSKYALELNFTYTSVFLSLCGIKSRSASNLVLKVIDKKSGFWIFCLVLCFKYFMIMFAKLFSLI